VKLPLHVSEAVAKRSKGLLLWMRVCSDRQLGSQSCLNEGIKAATSLYVGMLIYKNAYLEVLKCANGNEVEFAKTISLWTNQQ